MAQRPRAGEASECHHHQRGPGSPPSTPQGLNCRPGEDLAWRAEAVRRKPGVVPPDKIQEIYQDVRDRYQVFDWAWDGPGRRPDDRLQGTSPCSTGTEMIAALCAGQTMPRQEANVIRCATAESSLELTPGDHPLHRSAGDVLKAIRHLRRDQKEARGADPTGAVQFDRCVVIQSLHGPKRRPRMIG